MPDRYVLPCPSILLRSLSSAEGLFMLKNFTRQLFAQLSRHLPHRLVQRDPLPDARNLASAPIPDSLGKRWPERGGHG
ncbi:Magnesium-transporting ATPase, P-type 1 [Raoultella terrigena]|uniref:Magnesium-transporting ATPase, P-type 1 n=1 Tax=Raoultella terrigena TaxID=577 RepID=A0A4U9DB63_RAOTE|nr:Magnesium-transporting ATPase, P-type 1 [Raoultella terrigena]